MNKLEIGFKNSWNCGREIIYKPILYNDEAVGMITDVSKETIYGEIFYEASACFNENKIIMEFALTNPFEREKKNERS